MPPEVVSPSTTGAPLGRRKSRRDDASQFVPRLRLGAETILIDVAEGFMPDYAEVQCAVLQLSFVYDGVSVAASDPAEHVFVARGGRNRPVLRDFAGEARARQLLERYGPVEIESLDSHATLPGSRAEYLVDLDGDVDALCAFASAAVPKLQSLGWDVDIEEAYPCRVITSAQWYADVDGEKSGDWFELEMGVEVDGQRVDLLPALIDLLKESQDASGLEGRLRRARRPVAVPLGGRDYLAVPPDRLRAIVEVLSELYAINS